MQKCIKLALGSSNLSSIFDDSVMGRWSRTREGMFRVTSMAFWLLYI